MALAYKRNGVSYGCGSDMDPMHAHTHSTCANITPYVYIYIHAHAHVHTHPGRVHLRDLCIDCIRT